MEQLYLAAILVVIFLVCALVLAGKKEQLKKYERVNIGMSEDEMLSIMGSGYNKSSLKGNRFKYEWRVNATSYGRYGARGYSGVKKVDIYVKDGVVEEIKPFNVG